VSCICNIYKTGSVFEEQWGISVWYDAAVNMVQRKSQNREMPTSAIFSNLLIQPASDEATIIRSFSICFFFFICAGLYRIW